MVDVLIEVEEAFDEGMRDGQEDNWFIPKAKLTSYDPLVQATVSAYEQGYQYGRFLVEVIELREEATQ